MPSTITRRFHNRQNFFDAFRVVVRAFFDYSESRETISPEYDDCPVSCVYFRGKNGFRFCDSCPVGIAKADFEESTKETLTETCKGGKYDFKSTYEAVLNVISFQNLPASKQTILTARLIQLYESEKRRMTRIKDYIQKQNANQNQ